MPPANWAKLLQLIAGGRAKGACEWCVRKGPADPDHVTPRSAGGSDSFTNVLMLCRPCHDRKTFGTYLRGRLVVVPHWDGTFTVSLVYGSKFDPDVRQIRVVGRRPTHAELMTLRELGDPGFT